MNKPSKATVLQGMTLRLGRSSHNINYFDRTQVFNINNSAGSSNNSGFISQNPRLQPGLAAECNSYILLPLFAKASGIEGEPIDGIYSGKRSLSLPESKAVLNLKELGWASRDALQEFFVDVKGTGIKVKQSSHIYADDVAEFIKKHKIGKAFAKRDLEEQLVFSRNEYLSFESPEGCQSQDSSLISIAASDYFASQGFKIAPIICVRNYPDEIQQLAKEFDKEHPLEKVLCQEKRLMPSMLRATHLEQNPEKAAELVRLIYPDKKRLSELTEQMLDDMIFYFEHNAATASLVPNEKSKEKRKASQGQPAMLYQWDCIADLWRVFDEPEIMHNKDYGWFISKDLVIAGTGMYFVDLEVSEKASCPGKDKFRQQQRLYLTAMLKDFSKLLSSYSRAVGDKHEPSRISMIEKEAMGRLVDKVNNAGRNKIEMTPSQVMVQVSYDNLGKETYHIAKEHLAMQG